MKNLALYGNFNMTNGQIFAHVTAIGQHPHVMYIPVMLEQVDPDNVSGAGIQSPHPGKGKLWALESHYMKNMYWFVQTCLHALPAANGTGDTWIVEAGSEVKSLPCRATHGESGLHFRCLLNDRMTVLASGIPVVRRLLNVRFEIKE